MHPLARSVETLLPVHYLDTRYTSEADGNLRRLSTAHRGGPGQAGQSSRRDVSIVRGAAPGRTSCVSNLVTSQTPRTNTARQFLGSGPPGTNKNGGVASDVEKDIEATEQSIELPEGQGHSDRTLKTQSQMVVMCEGTVRWLIIQHRLDLDSNSPRRRWSDKGPTSNMTSISQLLVKNKL
ncbi:hypothetical protein RRG08_062609 [Elysia crispata]|uniref:Uncharacterized protein n=1 Tax=Elysia crispata TaxID=231223 RepID=A0AAE0Z069_9GAST|nr:hypothetical protein RRG08_062609 [Elysia crispata]